MRRLDAAQVYGLAAVGDLVEPMRAAFATGAVVPPRNHYSLRAGQNAPTLLVMPAWREGGPTGIKLVNVFPDNPKFGRSTVSGEFLLFSGDSGETLAMIDGSALTVLRTAAVSAVAADILAARDARNLLMIGTGALSEFMVEGHVAVRDYALVSVWGRDTRKAEALVARLAARGISAAIASDLQTAAGQADVISCATMATEPLLRGSWLKDNVHLDLVGSFRPTTREADDDCLRTAFVAVDTTDALTESGDLIVPLANGTISQHGIATLAQLARGEIEFASGAKSVFKSVGYALADLAAAEIIHQLSLRAEHGRLQVDL